MYPLMISPLPEAIIMKKIIPSDIKKFILDYRGANIMYGPEKSKDIAKFYAMHDKVFGKSKIALVMDKPEQVVFPMLVETEGVNFMLHPFFSIEAALEWVL